MRDGHGRERRRTFGELATRGEDGLGPLKYLGRVAVAWASLLGASGTHNVSCPPRREGDV